ncbi:hypothetical protein HELRODRAFT_189012 [Helobdella robusta]|uniref:PNN-interacting serine/arginine-rich protein n=1 Tax=Helobdella robusta TaxID=6412 RepID=T1FQK1_HELRO|nr:hypothetical protein HELRODRAFT_189012 [Helobdella robusta]ESN99159.1 hypothetical protein HELRODRAFT_189012 [Helobdella robusta]
MWNKESSNMPWGQPNLTGNAEQDWATLAKQWMQHRDMVGMPVLVNQQFPVAPPPVPQAILQQFPQQLLPPMQMQNYNDDYMRNNLLAQQQETVNFSNMESCNSLASGLMGLVNSDYHPQPVQQPVNVPTGMNNWNISPWAVAPPPPPPPPPTDTSELLETSSVHQDSDYFAARDINTEAPDSMTQPPPSSSGYVSTYSNTGDFLPVNPVVKRAWMPSAASNVTTTNIPATSRPVLNNPSWLTSNNNSNNNNYFKDLPFMDAAKRKSLPAWIRDGLEKMEREKYRQMERQKLEEEYRRRKSLQQGTEGEEDVDEQDDDDNVSDAPLKEGAGSGVHELQSGSTAAAADDGSDPEMDHDIEDKECDTRPADEVENDDDDDDDDKKEEELSDGEKEAIMMAKVKRMLTEVLLDVTSEEVNSVATFVYNKAKSRQLKGEEYDSDSEEDNVDGEAVENDEDGDNDDEDFEEAMKKIRMKRKAFEEKMSLLNSQSTSRCYPSTRSPTTTSSNPLETKEKLRKGTSESTTSAPGDQPQKQEKKKFHVPKKDDTSDSLSRTTTTSSSTTSSSESDAERKAKKKRKSFKMKKDNYLEKNIDNIDKVRKHNDYIQSKCSDEKKELAKDQRDHSKKSREALCKTSPSVDVKIKNYDLNQNLPTKIVEVKSGRLKTSGDHRNKSSERRSKSRNKSSKSKNRKRSRSRERKSRSAERSHKAKRFKDRSSRSHEKKSKRSSRYSKPYSRTEKHYTNSRSRS